MEAGGAAIAWAQGVIDLYLGYPTIVTTHSYLTPFADGTTTPPALTNPAQSPAVKASYNSAGYLNNSPGGWNGAKGIWDNLIAPNDQIFMVLCGHSWGSTINITNSTTGAKMNGVSTAQNIRIDRNMSGNNVYQVVTDYQGNTTLGSQGGDGWYRFMQFDLDTNMIHFYTYNAYNGALAGQALNGVNGLSDFDQPAAFSDFSLPIPSQVLNGPPQVNIDIVGSGFSYNRATKLYSGSLRLTNTSQNPISGTVAVALENLASGVTLANKLGYDTNGCPYTTVSNSGLGAGASLVVPVQFSDPSNAKITFTPVMIQV
jgi:hypothetical protein